MRHFVKFPQLLMFLTLVMPATSLGQTPNKSAVETQTVLREFWSALGTYDRAKLKESFDWPALIVEASASGTKSPTVLNTPQEFDELMKNSAADEERRKGKSEFYGTKLAHFVVQFLNPNLASVSYSYEMPKPSAKQLAVSGRALAVLRRDPKYGKTWKIIFMTLAQ